MHTCPACGAPVRLLCLATGIFKGTLLILESDPHPHGTVLPAPDGETATVPTAAERRELPPGTPLYRAHAVSCLPDPDLAKPSPARRKQKKGV